MLTRKTISFTHHTPVTGTAAKQGIPVKGMRPSSCSLLMQGSSKPVASVGMIHINGQGKLRETHPGETGLSITQVALGHAKPLQHDFHVFYPHPVLCTIPVLVEAS